MKKYIYILLFILLMLPINVKAEIFNTSIEGENSALTGTIISYDIVTENKLTSYNANIEYDKENLYLLEIKSNMKDLNTKIENGVTEVDYKGSDALISYTLSFLVKEDCNKEKLSFSIVTNSATENAEGIEVSISGKDVKKEITVSTPEPVKEEEPPIIVEEKNPKQELSNNVWDKINNFMDQYYKYIIYISVGLNLILLIALIVMALRKNADYKF